MRALSLDVGNCRDAVGIARADVTDPVEPPPVAIEVGEYLVEVLLDALESEGAAAARCDAEADGFVFIVQPAALVLPAVHAPEFGQRHGALVVVGSFDIAHLEQEEHIAEVEDCVAAGGRGLLYRVAGLLQFVAENDDAVSECSRLAEFPLDGDRVVLVVHAQHFPRR